MMARTNQLIEKIRDASKGIEEIEQEYKKEQAMNLLGKKGLGKQNVQHTTTACTQPRRYQQPQRKTRNRGIRSQKERRPGIVHRNPA